MSESRRALFLDRDGVVNVDYGYVATTDRFDWIDGVFDTVALARHLAYDVVIVTNQAGIAKGQFTEGDFHRLNDWMLGRFAAMSASLTAVYFCPFHPDGIGKYRRASDRRKPAPGMLFDAACDLNIDLRKSLLIGDQESDIHAGLAAGVRATALFATIGTPTVADAVVPSHREAAQWIAHMAEIT